MKTQTLIVTTVLAGLLTLGGIAQADSYKGKDKHAKYGQMSEAERTAHKQKRLDRMAEKLGLSNEQKTQIQALKQNNHNEIKPLRNEQRVLRQEIRQLDPNASDYAAKLADAANRGAELKRQMIIAKGNKRKQMAAILTPEQLAKMKEMKSKRRSKFHKK